MTGKKVYLLDIFSNYFNLSVVTYINYQVHLAACLLCKYMPLLLRLKNISITEKTSLTGKELDYYSESQHYIGYLTYPTERILVLLKKYRLYDNLKGFV